MNFSTPFLWVTFCFQGVTKVLSDSPGLVEWLVGRVCSYCSLPDWQALYGSYFLMINNELLYQKVCSKKLLRENDNVMRPNYKQFNFGLAAQTFGLVTSSNNLPEGQPYLFIFVSPCVLFSRCHQSCRIQSPLRALAPHQNIFIVFKVRL